MHCVCKQKQIYFFPFGVRITVDIETTSGAGHSSSESVADLPSQNAGRS
jgi:hypothetical protein